MPQYDEYGNLIPDEVIPPKPPPEVAGTIEGYGTRVISDKGNQGVWTGPGGEVASPDYVKDIQDTIAQVDSGVMSEPALREKIYDQQKIPGKPTDQQLTSYDRWKKMEAMAAPDLDAAEKEGMDSYRKNFSGVDELLMNPKETAAFHVAISQAGQERRDKELTVLKSIFDHQETLRMGKEKEPLVIQALREKTLKEKGREPTEQEKLTATEESAIRMASQKAAATEKGKLTGQKGSMSEAEMETERQYLIQKGSFTPEMVRLSYRTPGILLELKEYVTKKNKEEGFIGGDRVVTEATNKGLTSSLAFQEKQRGAAGNFVRNIDGQVDRVEKIYEYLQRTDARAINLPVRELVTRLKGSGLENVLAMYMKELSAEATKLSMGSSASVAQIPEGNRVEWERIHDLNLPIKDQRIVLQGTRDMAHIRLKSMDGEISYTQEQLKSLGGYKTTPTVGDGTVPNKPKFTIIKVR
jgi:hypothetical protein